MGGVLVRTYRGPLGELVLAIGSGTPFAIAPDHDISTACDLRRSNRLARRAAARLRFGAARDVKQVLIGIGWFLVGALVLFDAPWRAGRTMLTSDDSAAVAPAAARSASVFFLPGKGFPPVSSPPSSPETAPLSSDATVVASASAVVTPQGEPSSFNPERGRHGRFGDGGSRYRRPGRVAWPTDRLQAMLRAQVVQTP